MCNEGQYIEFSDGDIRAWIEQGDSVMLKASDSYGDPVELNKRELLELTENLKKLADLLDD